MMDTKMDTKWVLVRDMRFFATSDEIEKKHPNLENEVYISLKSGMVFEQEHNPPRRIRESLRKMKSKRTNPIIVLYAKGKLRYFETTKDVIKHKKVGWITPKKRKRKLQ